jgi:hypothetical protein
MATYKPTASPDFIKWPQFTEELNEGTLPLGTVPAPTVFKTMGYTQTIGKEASAENDQFYVLGSYDVGAQVKLGEDYTFSVTYRPQDTRMMRYGTELPNFTVPPDPTMAAPNGTNGVSISILVSKLIDGVEKYRIYTGVRTASISVSITRDAGVVVTHNFRCRDISEWSISPVFLGVPVFAANPTGDPWSANTSGADPFTIGATVRDTNSIVVNVDQGLGDYRPNGSMSLKFLKPLKRSITFEGNTPLYNTVIEGYWKNYTALAFTYTLAPSIIITGTSAKIDSYTNTDEAGGTDINIEEFSGTMKTVTLPAPP